MRSETFTGCLVAICVLLVLALGGWKILNRNVFGNKQFIDLKQNFNTAYIQIPGNKDIKIRVKKWNDYENSDSIQIISQDGIVYYTHLNRVVLTSE